MGLLSAFKRFGRLASGAETSAVTPGFSSKPFGGPSGGEINAESVAIKTAGGRRKKPLWRRLLGASLAATGAAMNNSQASGGGYEYAPYQYRGNFAE
jgi:hypothetical protein